MRKGLTITFFAALLAASPAVAADYRVAPVIDDSLWLGHFAGGRNLAPGAEPIPLDWIDVKQEFASLGDCAAWMKGLKRAYSTYEGYRTCVRIR